MKNYEKWLMSVSHLISENKICDYETIWKFVRTRVVEGDETKVPAYWRTASTPCHLRYPDFIDHLARSVTRCRMFVFTKFYFLYRNCWISMWKHKVFQFLKWVIDVSLHSLVPTKLFLKMRLGASGSCNISSACILQNSSKSFLGVGSRYFLSAIL